MNNEDEDHSEVHHPLLSSPGGPENRVMARQNIRFEMNNLLRRSIILYSLGMTLALLKIISSSMMIVFNNKLCNAPIKEWLLAMIVHDGFIIIVSLQGVLERITQRRPQNQNQNQNNNQQHLDEENPILNDRGFLLEDERNNRGELAVNKIFDWLSEINKVYFIGIFVWGHVILIMGENNCKELNPSLVILMIIYIIFGYFYLFYPVFVVLAICLCLPFLIVAAIYFGGNNQQPANNDSIDKLPNLEFKNDEFLEKQCVICQCEYSEGEIITQLPCPNSSHYFHEQCIKRWLKINGVCPICRHKI